MKESAAQHYPIPDSALAHHIAILGKTGSGKTTTAKAAAELILDAGGRVCVVDPTGAWWGMKSSASGKSAGFPVVIFGGQHPDFPLAATHGEAIAEIVGTTNTPAILDTSQMRVSERTRFFADFADGIMRKNRGPLHLIIDEAHMFMPQGKVPDPASGVMLAAGNNLVSGGRSRGLRIMLITQRPAKLHKDALTQVETLVAMRLIAPQDRKAVEEWIKDNADAAKGREIIESLATLKTGQGWVWAPEIGLLERATFPRIRTFDSSAAPTHANSDKGPVLAAIDKDAILSRLKSHAEQVVANDPAELKKRIRELEKQAAAKTAPAADESAIRAREKEAWQDGQRTGFADGVEIVADATARSMVDLYSTLDRLTAASEQWRVEIEQTRNGAPPENPVRRVEPGVRAARLPESTPTVARARQIDGRAPSRPNGAGADLGAAARKILAVLSQFPDGCTAGKLTLLTGYKYSGSFQNALSELRTAGLLVGANTEIMQITDAGLARGPFPELPTGRDLAAYWIAHPSFGKCAREVLRQLVDAPRGMTAQQLCDATGYGYSGSFQNALSELRTAGVLVGKNTEVMRASEDLF